MFVDVRRVDSSTLVFSLSSHRHSYTGFVFLTFFFLTLSMNNKHICHGFFLQGFLKFIEVTVCEDLRSLSFSFESLITMTPLFMYSLSVLVFLIVRTKNLEGSVK